MYSILLYIKMFPNKNSILNIYMYIYYIFINTIFSRRKLCSAGKLDKLFTEPGLLKLHAEQLFGIFRRSLGTFHENSQIKLNIGIRLSSVS